jgi:hypothetical protein
VCFVIGKFQTHDKIPTLKKPRAVQVQQTNDGGSKLRLGELVGSPMMMALGILPIVMYVIADSKIENLYDQSISNLVIANKIPSLELIK